MDMNSKTGWWGFRLLTAAILLVTGYSVLALLGRGEVLAQRILWGALIIGLAGGLLVARASLVHEPVIRRRITGLWGVGMSVLGAASLALAVMLTPPPSVVLALRWVSVYGGLGLVGAALFYALTRRFSNVPSLWVADSLLSVGFLLVSGTVLLGGSVVLMVAPPLAWGAAAGIAICPLIFGAHAFRALSDRNTTQTLAGSWAAIFVLYLILAGCFVAVLSLPGMRAWVADSQLEDLPFYILSHALIALIFGVANQAAAELHGQNKRVTGWVPLWLLVGSGLVGSIGHLLVGVLEGTLSQIAGGTEEAIANAIQPVGTLLTGSASLLACSCLIYAATFMLRRPRRRSIL